MSSSYTDELLKLIFTRTREAEAANYPFCTIDPNIGTVVVPDNRLEPLRRIARTRCDPF
jgi:ribosome-binding ATPase YchF (GTP1/OBG family)